MKRELNSRQWALYNALKEQGDEWKTQAEIATLIPEYNYDGEEDWRLFHDSYARHTMTADIRAINESAIIQKIIISSGKGVKIANKEEFERYIRKEIMASVRRLMRAKLKAKKGGLDGQTRITFGEYEREIIHAFCDSNTIGEKIKTARTQNKMTQPQAVKLLSKQIHIDVPMLSRIENGVILPTEEQLRAFADLFLIEL